MDVHGMFVDALNEKAKQFCLKLGFIALTGNNANSLSTQPNPSKSCSRINRVSHNSHAYFLAFD
ncbi:hypothetical protein M993_03555 [Obesumbacterium proteus ATCC 12841]|uniref:Uncharacterized protein n=1 Tax=Obesumbacterium proteus ATCC 12841 TaxID=1354268 RepID=A0AA91EBW2_9GAMM|nr:hypothetical protein M993_03555 [Obesumbacterium proteus ATCC 12841]